MRRAHLPCDISGMESVARQQSKVAPRKTSVVRSLILFFFSRAGSFDERSGRDSDRRRHCGRNVRITGCMRWRRRRRRRNTPSNADPEHLPGNTIRIGDAEHVADDGGVPRRRFNERRQCRQFRKRNVSAGQQCGDREPHALRRAAQQRSRAVESNGTSEKGRYARRSVDVARVHLAYAQRERDDQHIPRIYGNVSFRGFRQRVSRCVRSVRNARKRLGRSGGAR